MRHLIQNTGTLSSVELIDAIKSLPEGSTFLKLDSKLNRFAIKEQTQIYEALSQKTRILEIFDIGEYRIGEAADLFKNMHPYSTCLDLNYSGIGGLPRFEPELRKGWGRFSATDLTQAFSSLKPTVTTLNLRGNTLYQLSADQLIALVKSIPKTVTSLNLGGNFLLSNHSKAQLRLIFSSIHSDLTKLDLSNNGLSASAIGDTLQYLPKELHTLILKNNFLNSGTQESSIVDVFASIPKSVRHLELEGNRLGLADRSDKVIKALKVLSVEHLGLRDNNFEFLETPNFTKILASISKTVRSLDLSENKLQSFCFKATPNNSGTDNIPALSAIFASIPETVAFLNLDKNFLNINLNLNLNEDLTQPFKFLSKNIRSLSLKENWFNDYGEIKNIPLILASLPSTLSELYIEDNGQRHLPSHALSSLGTGITTLNMNITTATSKSMAALREEFPKISSVKTVNLNVAQLNNSRALELAEVFAVFPKSVDELGLHFLDEQNLWLTTIPEHVKTLKLSFTDPDKLQISTIAEQFSALKNIRTLVLKINEQDATNLRILFNKIPAWMTSLELDFASSNAVNVVDLASAFSVIPQTVRSLKINLKGVHKNRLNDMLTILNVLEFLTHCDVEMDTQNFKELVSLFQKIPFGLRSLTIQHQEVFDKKQLTALFEVMPETVQSVSFKGAQKELTVDVDAFWCAYLVNQVSYHVRKNLFATRQIIPPISIGEKLLNRLVALLEQKQTPLALFTCGLLLDGTLINSIEPPYSDQEYMHYMEKRTHDAISFYIKAAEDRFLKPSINFLLWELKTCSELESVRERLAAYTADPSPSISTYSLFTSIQNKTKVLNPQNPLRDDTVWSSPYFTPN